MRWASSGVQFSNSAPLHRASRTVAMAARGPRAVDCHLKPNQIGQIPPSLFHHPKYRTVTPLRAQRKPFIFKDNVPQSLQRRLPGACPHEWLHCLELEGLVDAPLLLVGLDGVLLSEVDLARGLGCLSDLIGGGGRGRRGNSLWGGRGRRGNILWGGRGRRGNSLWGGRGGRGSSLGGGGGLSGLGLLVGLDRVVRAARRVFAIGQFDQLANEGLSSGEGAWGQGGS